MRLPKQLALALPLVAIIAIGWATQTTHLVPAGELVPSTRAALLSAQPHAAPPDVVTPERATPASWVNRRSGRSEEPVLPADLVPVAALVFVLWLLGFLFARPGASVRGARLVVAAPRGPPLPA
jgi:hypothetical protein